MAKKSTKRKSNNQQTTKQAKAKFFQSIELNKDKYEALVSYAILNRTVKNFLSSYIYESDIRRKILMNEFDNYDLMGVTKDYRKTFTEKDKNDNDFYISATCFQRSCTDVFTAYSNQLETITLKKLSNCNKIRGYLAFFIKHYKNENELMSYVTSKKNSTDKDADFYKSFYTFLELLKSKNMYDRFVTLSLKMRERLINELKLIEFKSLTFQDMNKLTENQTKNISGKSLTLNNSLKKGNCVFTLRLAGFCEIPIIVKYSNKYHDNLSIYDGNLQKTNTSAFRSITYSIKFLENRKVRVIFFPKEDVASYKFDKKKTNVLGVDINTSDNLFSLSDGKQMKYEKKLFDQAVALEKCVSKKQKNKRASGATSMKYSKKIQRRINKMSRRSEFNTNKEAGKLIKYMKENGYDTLVCEDLNIKNSKTRCKKDGELNYNKLASYLHLNNYKNIFERLCKKNDINFVKVNPAFTSQGCSVCGHIDKDNRHHRTFLCKKCGHKTNADINAAINIRDRFSNEYLRDHLLRFDEKNQIYVGTNHKKKSFYKDTYQDMLAEKIVQTMINVLAPLKIKQNKKKNK